MRTDTKFPNSDQEASVIISPLHKTMPHIGNNVLKVRIVKYYMKTLFTTSTALDVRETRKVEAMEMKSVRELGYSKDRR
ncbi:unnamed protein product [Timema podura]|uniref:Uncharacterized protein n=1 Tax=Timema podura TaxID=61482 RepID=A0ABN7P4S3_TIMPD|nr:unnamed protein product [Timema podura]